MLVVNSHQRYVVSCTNPDVSAVEFATVGKTKEGKIYHHLWNADEINALLKEHGLAKVDDEPEAGDLK